MLKNTLNNKIQESWISHVWLAMNEPCMANYTLVTNDTKYCKHGIDLLLLCDI